MPLTRNRLRLAAACALVILGLAPLAWLFGQEFFGNSDPVSMLIPLRQGTYSSAWFTTRIDDLYELDLGTIPWRHDRVDLSWQIVDINGNTIAAGSWQDQTSGTKSIMLTRYRPKPGLRQRILVSVPHSVATSEASPTVSLYCPEATLEFAYGLPLAFIWAIVLLIAAMFFFIPLVTGLWESPTQLLLSGDRIIVRDSEGRE
jgi:hypothetical protein